MAFKRSPISNRKVGFKSVKKPILIVCEDSKSSVLYLKEKIRDLYLNPVDIEVDGNCDSSPISVVEYALKRSKEKQAEAKKKRIEPYASVYCVMDVDEHTSLKQAIQKALDNHLIPIVSNQCFELWYLLHFVNYSTAYLHRRDIEKELRKHLGKEYSKADKEIFRLLKAKGNEETAIALATRLKAHAEESSHERNPHKNPCTDVHLLIQKLNSMGSI